MDNPFEYNKIIREIVKDDDGWSLTSGDGNVMLYVAEQQGLDFLQDTVNEFIARWNHKPYHPNRDLGYHGV